MENTADTHVSQAAPGRRGLCRRCGGGEEFGVAVDLSRFFSDERGSVLARACGVQRVRWLLRRLARALALPPRVALLAAGRLLPPRERLRLLRPHATTLQVIPLPDHWVGQEGLRDPAQTQTIYCGAKNDPPSPLLIHNGKIHSDLEHHDSKLTPAVLCSNRTETDPQHRESAAAMELSCRDRTETVHHHESAPAIELSCIDRIENNVQHCESAQAMELSCSERTENKVQNRNLEIEETSHEESESDSQVDENLELERVKRRALELLERCAPLAAPCPAPAPAPRTRRPRVRRRRRRAPSSIMSAAPLHEPVPIKRHCPPPTVQSVPLRPSPLLTQQSPPPTRQSAPTTGQSPPPTRQSPPPTRHPPSPPRPPPPPGPAHRARSPAVQRNRSPRAASAPRVVRAYACPPSAHIAL